VARFGHLYRDAITAFALLGLVALLAAALNSRPQPVVTGGFNVIDGDSLRRDEVRFRLSGIDAPEYGQQCNRDGAAWACGREARALLVKLLQRGDAQCRGDRRDRYDRILVTCDVNGTDVNAEMVRQGMAVSFGRYRSEEAAARSARAGMWGGDFERPQDYRRDEETPPSRPSPVGAAADLLKWVLGWNR
jgi:endonuclease YncB( thermonuclease family)